MKKIDLLLGSTIQKAIHEGIKKAKEIGEEVAFDFNTMEIHVDYDSDPALIERDFHRGYLRPSGTWAVDAHPSVMLSPEQLAEDAMLQAEADAKNALQRAEWEAEKREKRIRLKTELMVCAPFSVKDEPLWHRCRETNTDKYGGRVVRFAEDWARLMQQRMSQGESIETCAQGCASTADYDGVTGFMYGAAVGILAHCWEHGEQLRRWHNLDTQLGDEGATANREGGVLNPALLRIG